MMGGCPNGESTLPVSKIGKKNIASYAPRLPHLGETLCGSKFILGYGGKGSNQCVASKLLGAKSLLVGRVGDDSFGRDYLKNLEKYCIPTQHVKSTEGVSTGMAQITVVDSGQNSIVIVLGANEKLTEKDLIEPTNAIAKCAVLLCQLEIPENVTLKALQIKSESKTGKSIVNAAPARSDIDPAIFSLPDIFCVNETEAEVITGIKVTNRKRAEMAVLALRNKGCREVIITLGKEGAMYGQPGSKKPIYIPTLSVSVVDTTGAGDAFMGALAYYCSLYPDKPTEELIKKANVVAAVSVQRHGAQSSFPAPTELPEFAEFGL